MRRRKNQNKGNDPILPMAMEEKKIRHFSEPFCWFWGIFFFGFEMPL